MVLVVVVEIDIESRVEVMGMKVGMTEVVVVVGILLDGSVDLAVEVDLTSCST
jgi:hypothetical protein